MTIIATIVGGIGAMVGLPALRNQSSLWYLVFCLVGMALFIALMHFFCALTPYEGDKS